MMDSLHIMHCNINGLRSKRIEVGLDIQDTDPDVICLNETRLNGRVPPNYPGYTVACNKDRAVNKTAGGGVAIYAKNHLTTTDISPVEDDFVAIQFQNDSKNSYF